MHSQEQIETLVKAYIHQWEISLGFMGMGFLTVRDGGVDVTPETEKALKKQCEDFRELLRTLPKRDLFPVNTISSDD
jgi:hypothetical protein